MKKIISLSLIVCMLAALCDQLSPAVCRHKADRDVVDLIKTVVRKI